METTGLRAGGTIAPSVFVKQDSSANNQVVQASAGTDRIYGISTEQTNTPPGINGSDNTIAAISGQPIRVYKPGDTCLLTTGASCNPGDYLKSDTSGRGVPASSTGTDEVGAIALGASSGANVVIKVEIVRRKF